MLAARQSPLFGYIVAILAIVAATALRYALEPLVGSTRIPFGTYYAAVTTVAFFSNLGAALFATVAAALLGNFLFVEPRMQFSLASAPDQAALALFLLTGTLVSVLADRLHKARLRLESAASTADAQSTVLGQERTRLQEIIASIPGVVWEAWGRPDAPDQRMNYVSDYVEVMLGYTPEECVTRPNFWLQVVAPEDRDAAARVAAERFAGGRDGENEFRWIAKDGRVIWALARASVIKDAQGTPVGMRGITFDITDRKEAERRLALLAEISTTGLLKPAFNEMATHIAKRTADVLGDFCMIRVIEHDALNAVAYAHRFPEAAAYLQALAERNDIATSSAVYADLLRNPRTILIDDDNTAAATEQVVAGIPPAVIERFRARVGVVCPLFANGRVFGTLAIGRSKAVQFSTAEITLIEAIAARAALILDNARLVETARREAAEAVSARAEAEEAGRVKDEFLATLSHELRTPLNAILGWAHMLQDPRLPQERRQAAIETIVRNAQSQEQLIADILDVQRIMAGKIRLNLRSVDLSDIVRAAAETVQPSAEAKQVRLQLVLDLDVPAIWGDSDRLKQVVWNLLSNAIKFAPQGGRVQVRLLRGDSECQLVVEDNGPGITPGFIPFMFERFRQADSSTTRTHKGLGLGLAIVRSLVEMHGGTIAANNTSEPGQTGAVFTIRLPHQGTGAEPTENGERESLGRTPVWLDEAPSLDQVRVLVVEDDADARELIGEILRRCGATVTVASSVAEGWEAFIRARPHVLISDIEMPEEDGYTLIRRIRSLAPDAGRDVPAAALTAYASPADRMKVLGAGFNIHMAKPVQPAELAIVVASLAGRVR
jgi:PAS domain S-box-containing protein